MYLPAHFHETDLHAVATLIEDHPLAALIAHTPAGLVANHLPLLRVGDDRLVGHVAKANDLHATVADGSDVLAIFAGDEGYVSPQWYPSKREHHRAVPTWNYQVVHVHGTVTFQHDVRAKRAAAGRLTKAMEARTHQDGGWSMADAPADYMDAMLDAIVAFEIRIDRIVAKTKASQNRDATDRHAAADEVERRGSATLARAMRRG